jgi:hypothetical protein
MLVSATTTAACSNSAESGAKITSAGPVSAELGVETQAIADTGHQIDGVALEVTGTDANGAPHVFYARECTYEEARAGALAECAQAGALDCHVTSAHTMYCRFLCLCE